MSKIILLKGLPASGKSIFSRKYCIDNPSFVRVNKDDIRTEIFKNYRQKDEKSVCKEEELLVVNAIISNKSVIIDSCNLNPVHEKRFRKIATQHSCTFEIVSFLDVTIEECIRRDSLRENSVGEKVIRDMAEKWCIEPYKFQEGLPWCVLSDIDGTLAEGGRRNAFDYTKVINDTPIIPVQDILHLYGTTIVKTILFSGRDDSCKEQTIEWLHKYSIPYSELYMRKTGDFRDDSIVKKELFNKHIRGKYNVLFVLDDRPKVCRAWRELGLFCLSAYQDLNQKEF